ncbi:unnamed protein product, partial [Polarella glacialis]
AGSSVEDNLALQMQTLIYQAATAMVECGAQSPEPLRAEPLGGFLLAAVWSPLLADSVPATLGIEAFPLRLLPLLGISFVQPDSGPVIGGTLITVTGNGFTQQGRLSCAFDDSLYMDARFVNSTTIYCTTPAFHSPGIASLRVVSWAHELSATSVNFTFIPRWTFELQKESTCFSGEDGDSVVLSASEANFNEWSPYVYRSLCLFTAPGPPMRVIDMEATVYAWNSTMRILCPCPSLPTPFGSIGGTINVSISLDGKNTIMDVIGGPVKVLKRPQVTFSEPTIWTVGRPLVLDIKGTDFPESSEVGMACLLFDDDSAGFDFVTQGVRQDSLWQGLLEDSCPHRPDVVGLSEWKDPRSTDPCDYIGSGASQTWPGSIAMVSAERISSSKLRCSIPELDMTRRGSMLASRSLRVYLAAKNSTVYSTQVAELPTLRLLPVPQIYGASPEAVPIVESEDTSTIGEALLLRVHGEPYFLSEAIRSRRKRCRLSLNERGLKDRIVKALIISDSEVACKVEQWDLWSNYRGYLSVTLDGQTWSNLLPVDFLMQVNLEDTVPSTVPPFSRISFNLTAIPDSLKHLEALRRSSTAWCDFGLPSAAPPTPARLVLPGRLAEDSLAMEGVKKGGNREALYTQDPGFVTWICHSPEGGFPPGAELSLSLVMSPNETAQPPLSKMPIKVMVLPSLDASQAVTPVVLAGTGDNFTAEIRLAGPVPSNLSTLCRVEDCHDVVFAAGETATSSGYVISEADGRLLCPLPKVTSVRAGHRGRAECSLRVSLDGGLHWSHPPVALAMLATPTLFDALPVRVSPDMFCERCTVVDLIGSHFNYDVGVSGNTFPRCWLGPHEGAVIASEHNVTTCSFHGGPVRVQPRRPSSTAVALGSGLFGVSISGPSVQQPGDPEPQVAVEVADPPVVEYLWPPAVYQEHDRKVYVYGASFPREPTSVCIFTATTTGPGRERRLVPGLNINTSLVICPLPELLGGVYQLNLRFDGSGVLARPHSAALPTLEVLHPLGISGFQPTQAGPRRSATVVLDGVSAPAAEVAANLPAFDSEALRCFWQVFFP